MWHVACSTMSEEPDAELDKINFIAWPKMSSFGLMIKMIKFQIRHQELYTLNFEAHIVSLSIAPRLAMWVHSLAFPFIPSFHTFIKLFLSSCFCSVILAFSACSHSGETLKTVSCFCSMLPWFIFPLAISDAQLWRNFTFLESILEILKSEVKCVESFESGLH